MAEYIKRSDVISVLDSQMESINEAEDLTAGTKIISGIILTRLKNFLYLLPTVNIKGGKKHG